MTLVSNNPPVRLRPNNTLVGQEVNRRQVKCYNIPLSSLYEQNNWHYAEAQMEVQVATLNGYTEVYASTNVSCG